MQRRVIRSLCLRLLSRALKALLPPQRVREEGMPGMREARRQEVIGRRMGGRGTHAVQQMIRLLVTRISVKFNFTHPLTRVHCRTDRQAVCLQSVTCVFVCACVRSNGGGGRMHPFSSHQSALLPLASSPSLAFSLSLLLPSTASAFACSLAPGTSGGD